MREVQFQETDARVLQIGPAARGTDARPRVETPAKGFFYQKAADKSAGAGDEDAARFFILHSSFFI